MIREIEIRGFRTFEAFTARGLDRVNLVVGRNNAGKTAFLEAIEWAGAGGSTRVLRRGLLRRAEFLEHDLQVGVGERRRVVDVRHLFHGRVLEGGREASVRADDVRISARIVGTAQVGLFEAEVAPLKLEVARSDLAETVTLDLSPDGGLAASGFGLVPSINVRFLGTDGVRDLGLVRAWRAIAGTEQEDLVTGIVRIVEPAVERVVVVGDRISARVFVRLAGTGDRVPLGSFGEGMRRLLTVAVELVLAQGGVLLVDEIDTGLHYSTLGPLWQLVHAAALALDVQVFATTHSGDCVRAVGWLHQTSPDDVADFAMLRVDRGAREAVRFSPAEIETALEAEMELRG